MYTPYSPSLCAIYPILLPSSISSPFLLPCHFKEHPYLHCYIFFRFFFALQRISMPNYIFHTFFSLLLFTPILMLINAFAMLAGAGGAPRAAISMGKKDNRTAEKILGNCFSLLIIMAVILTFIFFIFAPQMLTLFGASGKTLPYAVAYSRIYILGSIFVLIVMGMNPFITTQGFAKISMLTTVIGAVINIILDPIFIFVLDLGVRGAALATVLSQAVGAVWILRFLT